MEIKMIGHIVQNIYMTQSHTRTHERLLTCIIAFAVYWQSLYFVGPFVAESVFRHQHKPSSLASKSSLAQFMWIIVIGLLLYAGSVTLRIPWMRKREREQTNGIHSNITIETYNTCALSFIYGLHSIFMISVATVYCFLFPPPFARSVAILRSDFFPFISYETFPSKNLWL